MIKFLIQSILLVIFSFSIITYAEENKESQIITGQALYNKYGCINCHGEEGMQPIAKSIPILKNKSKTYLTDNINEIFTSQAKNFATLMHSQFCDSNNATHENCIAHPNKKELDIIIAWLSFDGAIADKKHTSQNLYLSASDAYKMIMKNPDKVLFLDIRTRAEVAFLGMPTIADANIPYLITGYWDEWNSKKNTFKLSANSSFLERVETKLTEKSLNKQSPIILICRSGSRSARAANILAEAGYSNVYTVTDGFEGDKAKAGPFKGQRVVNGWKNSGLPWTYKLEKNKMSWDL